MSDATVAETMDLPIGHTEFRRADLVFVGVDHSGPSYKMVIRMLGHDASGAQVADVEAGSYTIFGHGGCFGDEGHCDVRAPVSSFDYRRPHQLSPIAVVVVITEALKSLVRAGATQFRIAATPVVKESPFAKAEDAEGITLPEEIELRIYD
ncbi:MAG TPA: hypothetical protein VFW71_14375 [Actinomycetota bacterium]|nr:hypothetical protein [Actinomycetota bacterium]